LKHKIKHYFMLHWASLTQVAAFILPEAKTYCRSRGRSEVLSALLQTKMTKFPEPLVGVVEEAITRDRAGRVRCLGTSWPARFYPFDRVENLTIVSELEAIAPGMPVTVVALWGLTMLVVPIADRAESYPLAS